MFMRHKSIILLFLIDIAHINSGNEDKCSKKRGKDPMKKKIVLAYSGGLDTSAIIPWLIETYDAEIIAYCSDLGNAPDEDFIGKRAFELGAKEFIFEDLKDLYTKDFCFPAVRAGAIYQDDYLLGTALGRPLIAERMAAVAKKFDASAIAHGATGKGNDQVRFERAWAYLAPEVEVIAPWKLWDFTGREDLLKYLHDKGFPFSSEEKTYSVDVNLFHRSIEGGILEDPSKPYQDTEIYDWVKVPGQWADQPESVEITFEKGVPVTVNGEAASPATLLSQLNTLGGKHGIGVEDIVEERGNGIKSRGVYETPGGSVLHYAMKQMKHLCWDRHLLNTSRMMGEKWGELVYDGLWHSDAKLAIDGYFDVASQTLTGSVTLQLGWGQMRCLSRKSPYALYDAEMVSFESDEYQLHKYSLGYCKTISFGQLSAGKRKKKLNLT